MTDAPTTTPGSSFDEAAHPRSHGKFIAAPGTKPDISLAMFPPVSDAPVKWEDPYLNYAGAPDEDYDGDVEIPDHNSDDETWCPHSGGRSEDGSCPVFCREADDIMGIDAGERDDDDNDDY